MDELTERIKESIQAKEQFLNDLRLQAGLPPLSHASQQPEPKSPFSLAELAKIRKYPVGLKVAQRDRARDFKEHFHVMRNVLGPKLESKHGKVETFFGRGSSSEAALKLAQTDHEAYSWMKELAVVRGLI